MLVVAATDFELASVEGAETLCCGIGPVEASLTTMRALLERRPSLVLHIGIAGARGLAPLTLVLGSESIYCDMVDAGSPITRVERVTPDAALLEAARAVLPEAVVQPIATSARVGGGSCCDVEAMEGFGVLRAASVLGIPAIELRVVSNAVGESDRGRWQIREALSLLADTLPALIRALFDA